MKIFWIEFRNPEISERLLGCYIKARTSLQIHLFWPDGEIVSVYELINPAESIRETALADWQQVST